MSTEESFLQKLQQIVAEIEVLLEQGDIDAVLNAIEELGRFPSLAIGLIGPLFEQILDKSITENPDLIKQQLDRFVKKAKLLQKKCEVEQKISQKKIVALSSIINHAEQLQQLQNKDLSQAAAKLKSDQQLGANIKDLVHKRETGRMEKDTLDHKRKPESIEEMFQEIVNPPETPQLDNTHKSSDPEKSR